MELLGFLLIIGVFVAGFAAGKVHTYLHIGKLLEEVAKEQGIDLESEIRRAKEKEESLKPKVYKLDVEQHGDVLYLFDIENHGFICQGSSVQELCELAKKNKNVLYAAVKYGERVFQFKDGELTEVAVL